MRPLYVVVELVVAGLASSSYSLVDDSVSQLGAERCSAAFCSAGHALMNATFIGVGLLLASGALLLAPWIGVAPTVLLVVAGVSSIATGFAPIDDDPTVHGLAAAPLFVCHPVALLLLARRLRRLHPRLASILFVTAASTGAAALGFLLVQDRPGSGILERLALWPVLFALAAVATVLGKGQRRAVT